MIVVSRPVSEPPALERQRDRKLPPLLATWEATAGVPTKAATKAGWKSARPPLHSAQHQKCAYCEWRVPKEFHDVDHFWPKSRYWWLAWCWTNLLFACHYCNRIHKSDRLPVNGNLPVGETPTVGDPRLEVLDPANQQMDPTEHIEFIVMAGRWTPVARAGSALGDATIQLLGLDQPPILDLYDPHVTETVQPIAESVADLVRTGNHGAHAVWARALILGSPEQQFSALNRDALNHFVPASLRNIAGLPWPW